MLTRNWKWIIVSVIVASLAALSFLLRPPERRLLVLGTKVVSTKGWVDDNQDFYYQWLPGNKIFAWRRLPQNKCEPMEIDAATGNEIPLPGFHQRFPHPHSLPSGWQVSPDGKWLLWSESAMPTTWTAARLDGSQVIRWPVRGEVIGEASGEEFAVWRPDSRSWVEIGRRNGILHSYVSSLDTPASVQDTAVQEPKEKSVWYLSDAVSMRDVVAVTNNDDYGFLQFPTGGPHAVGTDLPLHVSLDGYVELKFTRDGRRVAWINQDYRQSEHLTRIEQFSARVSDWLNRLLKRPQSAPPPVQQLWVGDLDGKHKRLVGFIPPQRDQDQLQSIHWTPDDKRLSFIDKDTLYTVPSE